MVSCVPTFFEGKLDNSFEFFLLGCDGVWETKSDDKICNFLMKDINSPVKQCESLLEFVVSKNIESRKGKDNMSLILVRFKF
jgi:serine/threonine protein phosphatase PrpC